MDVVAEIRAAQAYLEGEISRTFEALLQRIQNAEGHVEPVYRKHETTYPLSAEPSIFKGRTPTCVLFGEERAVAHTWKNVFKIVILDCNSDAGRHKTLMGLRNKILGRDRVLLSDTSDRMRRPFKIAEGLFAETHYDTESLIRILLHRILDEVGYDYSNISVAVRNNG
jgi:hypothetical protein